MSVRRRRLRRHADPPIALGFVGWVGATATGVVVGHSVAYRLAIQDDERRRSFLAATGHSYWHAVVAAAAVLSLSCGLRVAGRHFVIGLGRARTTRAPEISRRMGPRLATLQVTTFLVLEVAERVAAHAAVSTLVDHGVVLVGVGAQIVVALALAWLLRLIARGAEAAGSYVGADGPTPRRRVAPRWSIGTRTVRSAPLLLAGGIRGPPPR